MRSGSEPARPAIEVQGLTMAFGSRVIQRELSFAISRGGIFAIMGGSGSGKSTLMRHLIGLETPAAGRVKIEGVSFFEAAPEEQARLREAMGVMFQKGALWSSMTLLENVELPLAEHTPLAAADRRELARLKLALVGLAGFGDFMPAALSGGMVKRAAIARAMALDPEILFLDEPSAGLDPISARHLDDLILELRSALGTTIVVVTHELQSIFTIADDSVLLDAETRTMLTTGNPARLLAESRDPRVQAFLSRGERAAPIAEAAQ
jgi:phospholipid/cholesterol/gamma-HCH transport system ATP-binding protein